MILLITTGGTICSSKNETGLNDLNTEAASLSLVSMYRENAARNNPDGIEGNQFDDTEFESISPINTLSENMTIDKWNQLIAALKNIDYSKYSGIMILHGTDTLHLTSALMGVLMKDAGCPVMMVSAHRILSDPQSNGVDNFTKSVELIKRLNKENMGGVYVVFRNMNGISYVHHATHLEECADYSEEFYSSDMIEYHKLMDEWDETWLDSDSDRKTESESGEIINIKNVGMLQDNVLYIRPYVGLNYDRINLEGVKAVLHNMYHSSTLNTEGDGPTSVMFLLKRCNELGIPFYIFPCKDGAYRYSSTRPLIECGAGCIYGGTWEEAYVRLLLSSYVYP